MSEEEVAVYRRRKTSRCENSDTRQRVIGGIGRRKTSSTNAIQGRIQQFTLNDALAGDANEDDVCSSDSSRLNSVINSPRIRRSSSNISSRSNSGSIAEIRASRRSRSNSSASSSTESTSSLTAIGSTVKTTSTPTTKTSSKTTTTTTTKPSSLTTKTTTSILPSSPSSPTKNTSLTTATKIRTSPSSSSSSVSDISTSNKTSYINKDFTDNSALSKYGAMNTPGKSRRISVATMTGKEVTQNSLSSLSGVKQQRSESTSSLGQGSLLRSKQMKWENLATENETKQSEEKSRTPSLYRRKISSNDLDSTSGNLPSSNKKETGSAEESLFSRNGTLRGSRRFRTDAEKNNTLDTKPVVTLTPMTNNANSPRTAKKTTTTAEIENQLKTVVAKKTSNDKVSPIVAKKPPPSVAPKKKVSPFHKTSTGIAQLQSQLEKDFDFPTSTSTSTTTATSKTSTKSTPSQFLADVSRKTKTQFESNSATLLKQHQQQKREEEKNLTLAKNELLSNNNNKTSNNNNNNNNNNGFRDVNNNDDSSTKGSVDLVKKYFGGDSDSKPEKPDKRTQTSVKTLAAGSKSTENLQKRSGNSTKAITTTTANSSNRIVNKSFDVFKTRDANDRKNVTSRDEHKTKERNGNDETNETKLAIKNTESKLLEENENSAGVKNSSSSMLFEQNKYLNLSRISAANITNKPKNKDIIIDNCDISRNTQPPPQSSFESVSDKKSSDIEIRHDNANYAGTESITNRELKEFVDQSGLSQQKRQGDIFSTENSLHRRSRISYVNEKSRSLLDPSFDVDDNTKHTNGINCDDAILVEKQLENHNYAKPKTTGHRDRSNTWTTSDSDESIISSNSKESSDGKDKSVSSLSNTKYEEKDKEPFERRRKLTKKRSKRCKTRPKVYMRSVQTRSIDTSDGDILESNYTSDDFSTSRSRELSSGPESTICESDLNQNYESFDVSLTNKNLNLSTANDNIETQSTGNNHNNKILISEATIKNSKIAELKEANRKVLIYDDSMKSSSMTTISKPLQQQNLMSFSSSNMGGSRSEDEGAKLFNLHKNKDERIGSVTSISKVRVIQTFNPAPFNPSKKNHQQIHSPSYSELSSSIKNSVKPIQSSPFSLLSFSKQSQEEPIYNNIQSEDIDRKTRLAKLKQGPFPDGDKPFQLTSKSQIPDEESKKNEELLESLPSSPFYMSERLVRDICDTNEKQMQSKSTGCLAKMSHIYTEKDIDIETDFSPASSPFKLSKSQSYNESMDLQQYNNTEFIAPPESFKDKDIHPSSATSKKIMPRPPLGFSLSKTTNPIDDIIEDKIFEENSSNVLRRPSYVRAQDSEENSDEIIPKVPPPPNDSDTQDVKVKKRLKRPGLPTISTSTMIKEDDLQKTVILDEDQQVTSPLSPDTDKEIQNGDIESDDDEDLGQPDWVGNSRLNGVGNKRPPSKKPVVQAPLLDGIPEVPFSLKNRDREKLRIKKRSNKYQNFQEPTIVEEPSLNESPNNLDLDVDSNNQGSNLRSTPRSTEDLSSERDDKIRGTSSGKKSDELTEANITNNTPKFNYPSLQPNRTADFDGLQRGSVTDVLSGGEETMNTVPIPIINTPDAVVVGGDVKPPTPPVKKKTPKPEMRRHVLQNLIDTENSYVKSMESILTMYFYPLKRPENIHIIEPSLLDEMFYQVPEILDNHTNLLEDMLARVDDWHDNQIIGDIFINQFTKHNFMDVYSNFINNFVQAKDAIRQACSRPQFTKYIEQCSQRHHEKFTLDDLMIQPVQRIPRYELIIKDMLKYTPVEHPDYETLNEAMVEVKTLAARMNKGEDEANQAEKDIEKLRDIEQTIEHITLVSNTRKFIRQDLAAENKGSITKKDRCLFLFSDLLVCTTVRRKNHVLRRNSLFTGQSTPELNRYKFLWKIPLEDVEVIKASNPQQNGASREVERLEDDIKTLNKMLGLSETISVSHQQMESSIRETIMEVRAHIQEKQNQSPQAALSPMLSRIELQAQTEDGIENYTFQFLSAECKSSWEAYFVDAKQKLAYSRDTFPPEFQYPTPITKTRSGMQFTCAAPSFLDTINNNNNNMPGDVWVCNSDGYVGQVSLLSMLPEVQSKASISVCSARIVCIAVVPGARLLSDKRNGGSNKMSSFTGVAKKKKSSKDRKQASLSSYQMDVSDDDDSNGTGAENIMAFDSSGDEDEPSNRYHMGGGMMNPFGGGRISPDSSSLGGNESMDGDGGSCSDDESFSDEDDLSAQQDNDHDEFDGVDLDSRACMWLGTEDRHIYIYNAQDTIPQRKSKARLTMTSPVTSILYFENKVFVALSGGELCIYKRDLLSGIWDLTSPQTIHVSYTCANVTCMTAVAGRIWCGCQNTIVLVNATSFNLEPTITVHPDHNRSVHKIVSSGLGVWVSIQSSAVVRLYHATTYDNLLDIDVSQAVQKMLAGADAIIRQHKAACLRVTSLLICKDLLWIGTSAGVILTNPLPSITASTSVLRNVGPSGSPHGHTGHVRFLTSVEVPTGSFKTSDYDQRDNSRISTSPSRQSMKRKVVDSTSSATGDGGATVTLVVSGGDGYEDFKYNQQTEAVGRDDSTNHLLIWRV